MAQWHVVIAMADGCSGCHMWPLRPDEAKDWTCCRALAAEIGIVSLPVSPFFGCEPRMDEHTYRAHMNTHLKQILMAPQAL